jgi:hypothetical protein
LIRPSFPLKDRRCDAGKGNFKNVQLTFAVLNSQI